VYRQANDFDNRVVVGKGTAHFEQLAKRVVQRLDGVGRIDHLSDLQGDKTFI
jgi:hypothetical protein